MEQPNDTSPDDLMQHFRGRSLKSIILFTIVVHVVVIGGTSIPFILRSLTGPNTEAMSEEERVELAVKEATTALRKIAEDYDIRPQKLSDQFAGKPQAAPVREAEAPVEAGTEPAPDPEGTADPEEEKSAIEKELEKAEPGPELPPIEEAVDLF